MSVPRFPRLVFDSREIGQISPISERTIARAIASGALRSSMVGGRRLVRRADLAKWLGIPESDLDLIDGASK